MTTAPAYIPAAIDGLDPAWSRIVSIPRGDGNTVDVHVLDAGPRDAELTLICVHGNPTWSYLWREVIAQAPAHVRVVALDHVGMGYSQRVTGVRRLAQRIDDLDEVIAALDVRGRIAVLAHDWGGPITLGWVQRAVASTRYADRIAAIVLTNTAVHQDPDQASPILIRTARLPWLRHAVTADTTIFLRGTTAISSVDRKRARFFRAPYGSSDRREAICHFVADIPFEPDHPSFATLQGISNGMGALGQIPTLLVWGMRDPVFAPRYLDDLRSRLPHAQVHQFADAGHLVLEDRPDAIPEIWNWITRVEPNRTNEVSDEVGPLPWMTLQDVAHERGSDTAVAEFVNGRWRDVTWRALEDRVRRLAVAFGREGIVAGQRVSVLIPPGADLIASVYALWRVGATVVVIDAAHNPRAMVRALRGARVDHVIATGHAAPIVAALRVSGRVVWRHRLATLISDIDADECDEYGPITDPHADAVIVFTSGATGVAKPVAYSWERLAATARTLQEQYNFDSDDVLIAAFAPWAVIGPMLGLASVIPRMNASRPGTLTADSLADAAAHSGGTVMWASPAAMRSVLISAPAGSAERQHLQHATAQLRLLMIAGAPVSRELLTDLVDCWPTCDVRTPYGMTEVLPATDVSAVEVLEASSGAGVLVGRAVPGVDIALAPVDHQGLSTTELVDDEGVLGEIVVRARHAKSRYDGRAFEEARASRNPGWHRTGDIGRFDSGGRLWVEGRLGHVITTPQGPVGPVSLEQKIARGLAGEYAVAAVGIGPPGVQVPIIVCAPDVPGASGRHRGLALASIDLADAVRAIEPNVAAVLWCSHMPVDIRHGAKVDRALLAKEASLLLGGHR